MAKSLVVAYRLDSQRMPNGFHPDALSEAKRLRLLFASQALSPETVEILVALCLS